MKSQEVILLLGGNEPNTYQIISNALTLIQKDIGPVKKISCTYQTAAWGPIPQPDYLNIAAITTSILPPLYLLRKLLSIETRLGRKRTIKYGPRSIDIDLLFYGHQIVNHTDLILPHPQIQNRRFVLMPCDEIIPRFIHPVLNKSIHQLLETCPDNLEVKKWKS